MALRLALGLGITAVMFAIAGRRFFWLFKLISAGQPAVPSRVKDVPKRIKAELVEVGGQRKLLQWTVPGLAHAFTFWGFTILFLTIIEAYGCLFQRDFHIPLIGTCGYWPPIWCSTCRWSALLPVRPGTPWRAPPTPTDCWPPGS